MELREHADVASFLAAASPLLLADEPRHNLLFGICATLQEAPAAYPEVHLWTIEDGPEVPGAALMTPPYNLVVAQPRDPAVLEFFAADLLRQGTKVPGVTGAVPECGEFAAAWEQVKGTTPRVRLRQGIYKLSAVTVPDGIPGTMRHAGLRDKQLLVEWMTAFAEEALPEGSPREDFGSAVERRLASETGGIAIWDDGGEPVSMSGFGSQTPTGIRIGPVYTPAELRRRGYASALVAQLSQDLLERGRDYCFLYTDLANPTSNRIYQNVGYELVCESAEYVFDS